MKIRNLLLVLLYLASTTVMSAQVVIRGGDSLTGTVSSARGSRIGILDDRIVFDASKAAVITHLGTARLSDIKKGDRVKATIAQSVGGELSASSVLILDEHDATLSGSAEQIDVAGRSVTLMDQQVRVTPTTVLRGLHGEALPGLGSIVRGQQITVAVDGAQSGLVAKSITITSSAPFYPTELYGTIESISGDLWTIVAPNARITVRVTPETTVVGTPLVGDEVFVTFRTGSDGLKVAISIGPGTAAPEPAFDVHGIVSEITATSLTLTNDAQDDSIDAAIDGSTVFEGGRPVVGARVVVSLRRQPDESFLAVRVAPDVLTIKGAITTMGADEWEIAGQAVVLNDETRVGRSLRLGDQVEVTALTMGGGKVLALEIAREPRHRVVNH